MKKYLLFALMALSLIFASCKSTDQETADETKADAETKIEQQAEDSTKDLSAEQLVSKAEESRAKAEKRFNLLLNLKNGIQTRFTIE